MLTALALLWCAAVRDVATLVLRVLPATSYPPEDDRSHTIAGWLVCPDCGAEVPITDAPLRLVVAWVGTEATVTEVDSDDHACPERKPA